MKFDRTVPGGSVEAECRLEGGKAVLEQVHQEWQ